MSRTGAEATARKGQCNCAGDSGDESGYHIKRHPQATRSADAAAFRRNQLFGTLAVLSRARLSNFRQSAPEIAGHGRVVSEQREAVLDGGFSFVETTERQVAAGYVIERIDALFGEFVFALRLLDLQSAQIASQRGLVVTYAEVERTEIGEVATERLGIAVFLPNLDRFFVPGDGVQTVLLALRLASAAPSLTREDAQAAFAPLHANLYRALDYVREGDVYDVLAHSADGPLLEALYRDMRRSLTIEEAGGAVGRVMAVRPIETVVGAIEIVPRKGAAARTEFVVDARWQVDGTVSHWGHRHDRTNEYRARYRVAATDGGWRIVSQDLLDEHRVDQPPAELPPDGPAPPVLPDDGIL